MSQSKPKKNNIINLGTLSLSLRWELSSVAWQLLLFISVLWVQSDVLQCFLPI